MPILPVLLPFTAALVMLLVPRLAAQRGVALASGLAGLAVAVLLLIEADTGTTLVYHLGNWPAPYGIVLVIDRLAALMVLLVSLLGLPSLLMAMGGSDASGRHFHALFQLLLAGLTGAFLTGDMFNLFVFFEILLLASYALLMHGPSAAEAERLRAGTIYVVLNLFGSSLFLVALALVYGTLGTLNLADIARLLPMVQAGDAALVRTAMVLMAAVFLLKAAIMPMTLWLPATYARAPAAVAALFVILTKVGVVMLLRLVVTGWGDAAVTEGLLMPWLPGLAIATILVAAIGVFSSRRLAEVAAWLVLISSGTLMFAVGFATPRATAALMYYLVQSTLLCAGLFVLAGHVAARRGPLGDRLDKAGAAFGREWLLPAWGLLAAGLAGLPPLPGFIGKLMLLQGAGDERWQGAWWAAVLLSSLAVLVVLARATGPLFWQARTVPVDAGPVLAGVGGLAPRVGLWWLVAAGPVLVILAGPMADYTARAAAQLHARTSYIEAVLGPVLVQRERRP